MSLHITKSYPRDKLSYDKGKIFIEFAMYSGFAKYKLGDNKGTLEVFNSFEEYTIPIEIEEGDYAGEIFGEFGNEIRSSTMNEKIKG